MNARKQFAMMVPRDSAEQAAFNVARRANEAMSRAVLNWSDVDACRRALEVAVHYRDSMRNGRYAPR